MGTASRQSSTSRSRSPRVTTGGNSQTIPALLQAQRNNMASSHRNSPQVATSQPQDPGLVPLMPPPSTSGETVNSSQPSLNIHEFKIIAADIKDTLTAAIADLRLDIHALTDRVVDVEHVTAQHDLVLRKATRKIDSHTLQLREIQRHVEDLENRTRRHNLRLRGLPETIDSDNLSSEVSSLFNGLLGKPPQTPIAMERIHRALRPRGRDSDPPRDIICCIVDFKLKEEILRQARLRQQLLHAGTPIQIFQDLSGITLQHRRDLKPLLEILRSKGIQYRWKFPFCLSASHAGRTALLKVPEDLHAFCVAMDIPMPEVPNWYAEFRIRNMKKFSPQREEEEPMDSQAASLRRRRSPSTSRYQIDHPEVRHGTSPSNSPRHRRARKN